MSMRPIAGSGGEDQGKERSASDDKSDSSVMDEARGILNKLTPDNFDKLVNKFMELQLEDKDERISSVISVVFEKAIDEPSFSATYAKLVHTVCKTSLEASKKFRKQILDQCQKEFQKCNTDEAEIKDVEQKLEEATDDETRDRLKLELEDMKFMVRRRSLGNVRFIGELYNLQMLSSKLMVECVHSLLYSPDEDNLECLCILLTTVGQKLDMQLKTLEDQSLRGDKPKSEMKWMFIPEMKWMDKIFAKLKTLSENKNLSTRIRSTIFDVAELRKNAWQSLSNSAIAVIANAQQLQQAPVAQAHGGVVTAIPTQHQPQHTHPQQPVVQPQLQPMPRQELTHEKKRKILTIVDPKTGRNVLEDHNTSSSTAPTTNSTPQTEPASTKGASTTESVQIPLPSSVEKQDFQNQNIQQTQDSQDAKLKEEPAAGSVKDDPNTSAKERNKRKAQFYQKIAQDSHDSNETVTDEPGTSPKERNKRKAEFYQKIAYDSDDANNSNRYHRAVDGSGLRLPDSQQQKKGDWTTVSKDSRFQNDWKPRRDTNAPKTIEEVRKEAYRQEMEERRQINNLPPVQNNYGGGGDMDHRSGGGGGGGGGGGSGSRLPGSQQQKKGDWTTVSKASRFQSVKKTEPLGSGSGTPIFGPPSFGGGGQWGQKAQSGPPSGPSQQSSIPPPYLAQFLVEIFYEESNLDWLVEVGDRLILFDGLMGCGESAWNELAVNSLNLLKLRLNEKAVRTSFRKTERRVLIPLDKLSWLQEDKTGTRFRSTDDK